MNINTFCVIFLLCACVHLLRAQNDDFGGRCEDGNCHCKTGYNPNDENKKCLGGVGQKCLYDEHCIPGAYCMSQSVCQCKMATPLISDNGRRCTNGAIANCSTYFWTLLLVVLTLVGVQS